MVTIKRFKAGTESPGRRSALLTLSLVAALSCLAACPRSTSVGNSSADGKASSQTASKRKLSDPSCEQPELWLALYSKEEIPSRYCAACQDACEPGEEGGLTMPWALLGDEDDFYFACNELAYLAFAIPAYHGMPVKDPFWKPYFEAQTWYKPDPNFSEGRLTKEAAENLRWAKGLAEACQSKEANRVSEGDWKLVIDWFARKESGAPPLPEKLFVDGKPASREEFLEFLHSEGLYRFDRRKPVRYMESQVAQENFPGKKTRTIAVYTGNPGLSCVGVGEDCEGFEWIELTFDETDTLLALHVAAAG